MGRSRAYVDERAGDPYWTLMAVGRRGNKNRIHWLDWFGFIDLTEWQDRVFTNLGIGRNFYHFGLGWCWVPVKTAPDAIWLWSHTYHAWVFVDPALPHCAWVSDGSTGWIRW